MIVKIKRQAAPDKEAYWQSFLSNGPRHVTVAAVLDALNYTDDLFDTDGKPAPVSAGSAAVCRRCAAAVPW